MKKYSLYQFENLTGTQQEILSGLLSALPATGAEETETGLNVFFDSADVNEDEIREIAAKAGAAYRVSVVEDQNWNSLWESNFEPVVVEDFLSIRADFHPPAHGVDLEIVITPKMSFGTGHHATTWSMVSQMRTIPFDGRSVLDFGTGTGILAILAKKLGAASVKAIDNDEWSIDNSRENFARNNTPDIMLELADVLPAGQTYDVILANINKNVLLANMQSLRDQLSENGVLLMSGLLAEDEEDIVGSASGSGLKLVNKTLRLNWLCLRFTTSG